MKQYHFAKDTRTLLSPFWKRRVFFVCFLFFLFSGVLSVSAQFVDNQAPPQDFGVQEVEEGISLSGIDIRVIVGKIIRVLLGLLGIIALGIILYGGYTIMVSGGNADKVEQGKKILMNGVIGLVIILSSLAIVQFLLNALTNKGGGGGGITAPKPPAIESFWGSGGLGGLIKDHYPFAGQVDVPRDTQIFITFREPILPESIILDTNADGIFGNCLLWEDTHPGEPFNANTYWSEECDQANPGTIRLYQTTTTPFLNLTGDDFLPFAAMTTYDAKNNATTFVLKPHSPLGNDNEKLWYTARITGGKDQEKGLLKKHPETGEIADGYLGAAGFYAWNFQTDTVFDETPPTVLFVTPVQGSTDKSNKILRIDFSEAMDPLQVQGIVDQLDPENTTLFHIAFGSTTGNAILPSGEWIISNGYTTVEFIPNNPCGQNACGEQIYCIQLDCTPGDTSCTNGYQTLLRTAQLINTASLTSFKSFPFTGITDASGNALDGNVNGIANGKPSIGDSAVIDEQECAPESKKDNYCWDYTIQNEKDLIAPYIKRVRPGPDGQDVVENAPLSLEFSKLMLSTSLYDIDVKEYAPADMDTASIELGEDAEGNTITLQGLLAGNVNGTWPHSIGNSMTTAYGPTTTIAFAKPYGGRGFGPYDTDLYYFPTVSSTLKDAYQNCLYPGIGPFSATPEENIGGSSKECTFNQNTGITNGNCVMAAYEANTDTGCAVTSVIGKTLTDDSPDLLKENIPLCLDYMESKSL